MEEGPPLRMAGGPLFFRGQSVHDLSSPCNTDTAEYARDCPTVPKSGERTVHRKFSLKAAGMLVMLGAWAGQALADDISGAGATFPYPIYAKWAEAYKQKTGIGLNYQSIGSGGGIKQIEAGTVTFGASDKPLEAGRSEAERPGAVADDHRRRGAGGEHSGHQAGRPDARWPDARGDLSWATSRAGMTRRSRSSIRS